MNEEHRKPTLFLIDGNNYVFRAFYAIPGLTNSRGFPTNAVYGFTTMLVRLLKEWRPDYIAVAFDVQGPTFRHDAYEHYKATRREIPADLVPQLPRIREVVRGFSIPILEKQGVEADDIIGTLAARYAGADLQVYIVSGDKDMMQLVNDHVLLIDTMKDKIYDAQAVRERFGVPPDRVVEIMGLTGDTSDNIPGAPGIGPKGALRLIEEFGTIENILNNLDKVKNARAREALRRHADQVRMSRELAVIRTDEEIPFDLDTARRREPDGETLKALFRECEFSSLLQELKLQEEELSGNYTLVTDEGTLRELLGEIRAAGAFTLEVVLNNPEPMRAEIVGIALGIRPGQAFYLPLLFPDAPAAPAGDGERAAKKAGAPGAATAAAATADLGTPSCPEDQAVPPPGEKRDGAAVSNVPPETAGGAERLTRERFWELLSPLLGDQNIRKHGHDLKPMHIALTVAGAPPAGLGDDTLLEAYVLNPSRRSLELTELVQEYLRQQLPAAREVMGSGARQLPPELVPLDRMTNYAAARADAVLTLRETLAAALDREALGPVFREIEMPLVPILARMERTGVLVDVGLLRTMSREMQELLEISAEKIYRLAGERFNINSPKQLQHILFEKLRLAKGKKTKDGYSTDVDVLSGLARHHELPAEILAYRSFAKLKSTYIDALPSLVHPRTGRVHASFNQAVTATGRLSSSNPNLQNIPVRTVEGKRIRQAFIAPPGWRLVSADYSQIELRVLAHLSGDATLIESFRSGEDIHSRTASTIFGVFPEFVNEDMRRQAKVINFGILYGMSAFGLARELDVNQKLAQAYIDEYFRKYAGVKSYLDGVLERARRDGYVCTLMNRRRYLPEINAANANIRQFAERMALNTPIQGTAADLIKMAMIRIDGRLAARHLSAAMIMQVHDELVLEVPEGEVAAVSALVREEMETALELTVPLQVAVHVGRNWDDAH
ncbi:MAG TPA: DNA polymerase I [Syntrophales bacterium]|nr:DNA polymerase I [Syntrophales bacterium]HRR47003.1 DNA polymerase I [Syntrophales bacterium]